MKKVRVFSNSNKVELTLSTWELLFIVTSLIKVIRLDKDITNQLNIVTKFLGDKFLNECMEQAEICLNDNEKFDEIYLKFKKVGNQFSTQIEEG